VAVAHRRYARWRVGRGGDHDLILDGPGGADAPLVVGRDAALVYAQWLDSRIARAIKALATVRRLLPPALVPAGAGPAVRPAEAGSQEDEAGPESRRPKPGTAKAANARDEGDLAKGANAALVRLDRDDRERDG
jgi:hypothetical protein